MVEINKKRFFSRRFIQYGAVFLSTFCMFSDGLHATWTSSSLPKLYANDSLIPTTVDQGSWIASIMTIGGLFGPPLAAYGGDCFGRKNTMITAAVALLISWLLIAIAGSVAVLCVARFIAGLALGYGYTISPMYIGEIAEPEIRGRLSGFITIMLVLGEVFMYSTGPFISIKTMAISFTAMSFVVILFLLWIPESPYYLLLKNDRSGAEKSLQALRGEDVDIEEELKRISVCVQEQMASSTSWKELFTVRSNVKAVIVVLGLITAVEFSGLPAFLYFTELIFKKAESDIPESISAIMFGLCQLISCVVASFLVDRLGRKPLLIVSSVGSAMALGGQTVYFYFLERTDYDVSTFSLFPVILMLVYTVTCNVGLNIMPCMLLGELFPVNVKAKAACMAFFYYSCTSFIITKLYQGVVDAHGTFVPFCGFTAVCIVNTFFVIFYVPETKGKSLDEIQKELKGS